MTMPPDWWRDFFSGLAADFWHAMPTPAMTAADVDTVIALAAPTPRSRILDVPCGDGRHSRELAARGFVVDAVDRSPALLAHARVAATGGVFTVHEQDMRELPWPATFDLACCLGNSFGYLGDDGDLDFLRGVRGALRPGGRFVLDAAVLEVFLPVFVPRRWYEAGGVLFCSNVQYDPGTGVVRSDYTMTRGAEVERRSAFLRVRAAREVLGLLAQAGFASAKVLDDRGAPLQVGAQRAWFVATA